MSQTNAAQTGWTGYQASVGKVSPDTADKNLSQWGRAMLGISLENRNARGARLEACVRWIGANLKSCLIAIGDSAHQHTLQITRGMGPAAARSEAVRMGKAFIEENRPLFERHGSKCSFEFSLMSELEKSPGFKSLLDEMETLYQEDRSFRSSIDSHARRFQDVLDPGDRLFDQKAESASRLRKMAVAYTLEELSMFATLHGTRWPVLIYPGAMKPLQELANQKYPGAPGAFKKLICASLQLDRAKVYFMDEATGKPGKTGKRVPVSQSLEFLPDFSNDEWDRLISYTTPAAFKAGDIIIEEGQKDRSLYILARGEVEIVLPGSKGQPGKSIATLKEGTVFGELALLDGRPRSARVSALCEGQTFRLSLEDFGRMRKDDPDMACSLLMDIGRVLSIRNRNMNEKIRKLPSI